MAEFFNAVYVVVAVLLLFGAAIFVHEYGHFYMARRRGLKVEGFSIGFGPKIYGWTRDGIEYAWRWIPAGGYVKLPQMITSEAIEGRNNGEPLPPVSPWSKTLVAFAGPAMNVVFGFAIAGLLYFTGIPTPVNPAIVGHVDPESEEYKLGIRDGDRIVAVDGRAVSSWEEVLETTALARTNRLLVALERQGVTNTCLLTTIKSPVIDLKMLNLQFRDHPVIRGVREDTAAKAAGLLAGDEVLSFGGVPLASQGQFVKLIQGRPGQETELVVKREGRELTLKVTPRLNPATGKGLIGAEIGSNPKITYQVQRPGPTPWTQVADVLDRTYRTFAALIYSKQTGVGLSDLSGPAGILARLAAEVHTDYRLALSFLVLLNINLAILNLLPIPVLDGGHIVMAGLERLRGRPLSLRVVEYTTTAFALLLISFMLYVTFFDIKRFPLFKSLFQGKAQVENVEKPAAANGAQPVPAPTK